MIGLGRMGSNMVRRLQRSGHECVGYDVNAAAADALTPAGVGAAHTLEDLCNNLATPRAIWMMVPAAFVADTIDKVAPLLSPGDTLIDGGNSWYRDDVDRSRAVMDRFGVHYLDIGTSGGVHGLERGYCLMVGGDNDAVDRLAPILDALAPGADAAPSRTPGRTGPTTPAERGWLHCGPSGAGHFVKMIHNGIEYGLMAAYAEGLNVLANADAGLRDREADAETTPLEHPERYRYSIDVAEVAEVWRRGSVISSWLLDLTAAALHDAPTLEGFAGRVSDSGEGRWTAVAAIDEGVPTPVLTSALAARFSSRGEDDFANRVLSALRKEFGGHIEKPS